MSSKNSTAVAAETNAPAPQSGAFLFDANKSQRVPLTIVKGAKEYNVAIEIAAIEDEEWFTATDAVAAGAKRSDNVSIDLYQPFADLGRAKAIARYGYKERPDWREAGKDADFISAVKAVFEVRPVEKTEDTSDLLDDDDETPISLIAPFEGTEIDSLKIFYREPNKEQMDEFLNAFGNKPSKRSNVLASAKKVSAARRLHALSVEMSANASGYASRVPAWHHVAGVTAFMMTEFARMGKF